MILYHGTDKKTKKKILKEGFTPTYGEYGTCVYLAKHKDLAYDYGDAIITVYVDDEYIEFLDMKDIKDNLDVEYLAQKNEYKAVGITFNHLKSDKDYTEICVYDLSVIEINK